MARKSRQELGITESEYKEYQKIRKERTKLNKQLAKDFSKSVNPTYSHSLMALRKKEFEGKRFTIGDFKSKYDFEQFMQKGKRYTDYNKYVKDVSKEYTYNFKEALRNMGADIEQLERFDEIIDNLDEVSKLSSIYAENEELDLSYVYTEVKEQGSERIDMTLDVLEELVNEANEE